MSGRCPESSRIQDWLDGLLEPVDALRVREHAQACPRCAREVALYRRVFASLERLPVSDPGPAFTERVLDRVLPSRLRRRWVRALGFGYAGASALTVAAAVMLATQPAARAALELVSTDLSRRLAHTLVLLLNGLGYAVLGLAAGGRLLESTLERATPLARALQALFSQPTITVPLTIAAAVCILVLWWMRPREAHARKEAGPVGLLGF